MSVEENKELVRRFYGGDFARGITANVAQYFSSDFVDHDPPGPVPPGPGGVVRVIELLSGAMPERSVAIHDVLGEGDRVTIRFTIDGEQQGFFPGREGKTGPMRIDVIAILRVEAGKIVERWGNARVR